MTNTTALADLVHSARDLGIVLGRAKATWFELDGSEHAQRVLDMINDCDPEWYDSTPSALSGEWAGDMTPAELLQVTGANEVLDLFSDFGEQEILDAYEEAFNDAYEAEIVRACNHWLHPVEP